MTQITKEHLDFVKQAKVYFEESETHTTYRDEDVVLIGLRYGADNDCINVFELGDCVANFVQQIESKGGK